MPVQWLDVGSWPALAETLHTDDHDNATDCKTAIFLDSDNNIVVSTSPDHLMSLIGVSDMIIVHTPDATLICPKSEAQRVKEMATNARSMGIGISKGHGRPARARGRSRFSTRCR